jgi:hypothetical protein
LSLEFFYTRTVEFESEVDAAHLPAQLAESLRRVKANNVTVQGNCVTFKAGGFRWVTNWNVLVPFGFGDLSVDAEQRCVRYRQSLRQMGIAVAVQTIFLGVMAAKAGLDLFLLAPLAWAILMGANLAIALPRFQFFLRRTIQRAPRRAQLKPDVDLARR